MPLRVDTVIIGAGQAGLALSHCLTVRGIEHVVLERGRVGERWLSERWPELRLLSPNFVTRLPGLGTLGDPEGFMRSREFGTLLNDYGRGFGAPIRMGCEVVSVNRAGDRFFVFTTRGAFSASAVVIATGACDQPAIPAWAEELPDDIRQVTATNYIGPDMLDEGGVLVVGASATGMQIARDLSASGRPVTISVGRHAPAPRRYRGRDLFYWLERTGYLFEPRDPAIPDERLLTLPSLQLAGGTDRKEINLDRLKAQGVTIAGRALGVTAGKVHFDDSLPKVVYAAEIRLSRLLSRIDHYISGMGFDAPPRPEARKFHEKVGYGPRLLNLEAAGIRTVVWATGFRRTYPWLRLPVLDSRGEILHAGGATPEPGLFAMGLPFMRQRSSAFIYGTGRDAEAIAEGVAAHLTISKSIAA
ncbi:MAG: NAD(P)-binding domain-containing protein [Rhodobacteraceae bacterium]|nr:NAD(P)-binding domain-containing protein [Paracoccaceae bacterium]